MLDIEKMQEERLAICKECPLYKDGSRGPVCNSSKYISPDGKDWSWIKKEGYKRGCSCALRSKVANPNSHCIISLW